MNEKKVFLLTKDPLMYKAWEVRLKNSSWLFYGLESLEEFSFRVKDFAPDIIILGEEIERSDDLLKDTEIPAAVMVSKERKDLEPHGVILIKPIEINKLESILDQLLTQIS